MPATERRRLASLVVAQVLGGVGVASGIAVGGLLAQQVSGSTSLSGLSQTAAVLGAALLAVPLANLARARGRGQALATGYGLAFAGAVGALLAAVTDQFWLLLAATVLFGGGTAAGLQSRYAATDGVPSHRRGRALSTVVWATTVGAVAGPNLSSVGGDLAGVVGVPSLSGPYLFSMVAFAAAGVVVLAGLPPDRTTPRPSQIADDPRSGTPFRPQEGDDLRPDPVTGTRRVADPRAAGPGTWTVLREVARIPRALLGLVATACGHAVMIAVMVMTPVYLGDGDASLEVIGIVISLHVAGMYALSPVFGWLVDRFGEIPVIGIGLVILAGALTTAATAGATDRAQVGVALVLLGLGWSASLVSGSSLLSASVRAEIRTTVQGTGDLVIGVCAAAAGVLSGPILSLAGYPALAAAAAALLVPVLLAMVRALRTPPVVRIGASA